MDVSTSAARSAPRSDGDTTPVAARAVGWLSVVLAGGSALLALGHLGLSIPVLSALGPGGDRAVPPAAAAFAASAVLATAVAVGAFRRRPWAWALGLVVHALTVLGAAMPYRGVVSLIGIGLGVAAVVVLVSRPGRAALLRPQRPFGSASAG